MLFIIKPFRGDKHSVMNGRLFVLLGLVGFIVVFTILDQNAKTSKVM